MYDLIVIGSGWAGFNACMAAKQHGLKTALVERSLIGGTCLNSGCIPTKALIQSAKAFHQSNKFSAFGIVNDSQSRIDFVSVQDRKNKLIGQLRSGMEFMLKGIDIYKGNAVIIDANTVSVDKTTLQARWILAATGSAPSSIPALAFDGEKILSSDQILELKEIPQSLLIVGGGVIGCEFASLFSMLGTKVTIAEAMPRLLPGIDSDIVLKLENSFRKAQISVLTCSDATTLDRSSFEKILVCVGRKPLHCAVATAADLSIYTAGDCTGTIMLAHYAAFQGRNAVENMIAGRPGNISRPAAPVPNCIFTNPEIASAGMTEDETKKLNIAVKIHKFDFLGSGMARIMAETEGFIKIISDADSKVILGASIIGPKATELISTLTVAIQAKMTTEQLAGTILPHPTLSEAITEALHRS